MYLIFLRICLRKSTASFIACGSNMCPWLWEYWNTKKERVHKPETSAESCCYYPSASLFLKYRIFVSVQNVSISKIQSILYYTYVLVCKLLSNKLYQLSTKKTPNEMCPGQISPTLPIDCKFPYNTNAAVQFRQVVTTGWPNLKQRRYVKTINLEIFL